MNNQSHTYHIFRNGKKIYSDLTQDEYFDRLEDLAIEYYQTGSPNPSDLKTEITVTTNHHGIQKIYN